MKRMQSEIEETKSEMKTVESGLQGLQKEVSSLNVQTNSKLDRIARLLEDRPEGREGTPPQPSRRRISEDGDSTVSDMDRMLFIKFAADAETGEIVSADLKSRDTFISDSAREWMEL